MKASLLLLIDCQKVLSCPSIILAAGCAYLGSDALHNERTRSRGLMYPCFVLKYCAGGDPHVMLAEIVLPIAALKPCETRRWDHKNKPFAVS